MSYGESKIGTPWRGYYITAYGIAVKHGFKGTEEEWLESLVGKAVEIRYNDVTNVLEWSYVGEDAWTELLSLEDLQTEVVAQTLAQAEAAKQEAQDAQAAAEAAQSAAEAAQQEAEQNAGITQADASITQTNVQLTQEAKTAAEAAQQAAQNAQQAAEAAGTDAEESATLSKSWAVGGTGTRPGEDTNNAEYWAKQAAIAAGGGVLTFNGRTGNVAPEQGDYTPDQVGAADKTLSNLTDYQKALFNIGGRPNRNLIINHKMIGTGDPGDYPINQREKKLYTPDWLQYSIDMWKVEANQEIKVEIKDGFVTVTNTSSDRSLQFEQWIPEREIEAGKTYTLSTYVRSVSGDILFELGMTESPYQSPCIVSPKADDIVYATVESLPQVSSGGWKCFYLLPPGATITLADQKLESGPVQTLGWKDESGKVHLFDDANYSEDLVMCQGYLVAETAENEKPGTVYSNTSGVFTIPISVQMRTTPVLEELKGYEPKIALSDGSTVLITKEEITVLGVDVSGVRIRVDVTGGKTLKNGPASIRDCNMVLSAEL